MNMFLYYSYILEVILFILLLVLEEEELYYLEMKEYLD
jgi:hypothetical protein